LTYSGAIAGRKVVERVDRRAVSLCAGRLADLGRVTDCVALDGDPLPDRHAAWCDYPFVKSAADVIRLERSARDPVTTVARLSMSIFGCRARGLGFGPYQMPAAVGLTEQRQVYS